MTSEVRQEAQGFLVRAVGSEFQAGVTEIRVSLSVQRLERVR
jgi:hypothetical protein